MLPFSVDLKHCVFVSVHFSIDSRAQQYVMATQCTQKSDSHSQMHLPAHTASDIPVLASSGYTPGCERSATRVDRQLHPDSQGAAGGENSSSVVHNRNISSAVSRQQMSGPALPEPQVPYGVIIELR